MEAVEFVQGEADDVVVAVGLKGYEIGGRVIRPAAVTVSATEATLKAKEEEEKKETAAEEGGEDDAAAGEGKEE